MILIDFDWFWLTNLLVSIPNTHDIPISLPFSVCDRIANIQCQYQCQCQSNQSINQSIDINRQAGIDGCGKTPARWSVRIKSLGVPFRWFLSEAVPTVHGALIGPTLTQSFTVHHISPDFQNRQSVGLIQNESTSSTWKWGGHWYWMIWIRKREKGPHDPLSGVVLLQ